jgi:hypothetical protein
MCPFRQTVRYVQGGRNSSLESREAKSLFGKPVSVITDPRTNHELLVWRYAFGTGLATGRAQELAVSFDQDGRMLKIIQRSQI